MSNLLHRSDVIFEIISAIESTGEVTAEQYDIDAIADDCFTYMDGDGQAAAAGWVQTADFDQFWSAVAKNEKKPRTLADVRKWAPWTVDQWEDWEGNPDAEKSSVFTLGVEEQTEDGIQKDIPKCFLMASIYKAGINNFTGELVLVTTDTVLVSSDPEDAKTLDAVLEHGWRDQFDQWVHSRALCYADHVSF